MIIDPTKNVAEQIRSQLGLKSNRPSLSELMECESQFDLRISDDCTCGGHTLCPAERDIGIFHPYLEAL